MFYLVILLGFSLVITAALRVIAEHEYARSTAAQLSEVRHLLFEFPWKDLDSGEYTVTAPDGKELGAIQDDATQKVRYRLNRDFALINGAALVVAGVLSYWFAGRTLRPIEEAHRAQTRFASDASHELRTPLAAMRVENEVFLRQPRFTEEEARDQIKSNLEETQRLEDLANNLLALTHFERAQLQIGKTTPAQIVEEAIKHAQKSATAREITFKQHVKSATLYTNQSSVAQLMGILLDNAMKYGPQRGTITISGIRQTNYYILTVADQGPGIDPADMPHIFERLYRSDKARSTKAGGYGLGLALAREIAKANRGTISVKNNPKGGASFCVRLPL
jgi:signal transduction histidine kinase